MTPAELLQKYESFIDTACASVWPRLRRSGLIQGTSLQLEDIRQETCLWLLRGRSLLALDPDHPSLGGFIYVVTWRAGLRLAYSERRSHFTPDWQTVPDLTDACPIEGCVHEEANRGAQRGLGKITELRREAVIQGLALWDDGIPEAEQVAVTRHRGLEQLLKLLWPVVVGEGVPDRAWPARRKPTRTSKRKRGRTDDAHPPRKRRGDGSKRFAREERECTGDVD